MNSFTLSYKVKIMQCLSRQVLINFHRPGIFHCEVILRGVSTEIIKEIVGATALGPASNHQRNI